MENLNQLGVIDVLSYGQKKLTTLYKRQDDNF